jgi:hypothetical protein
MPQPTQTLAAALAAALAATIAEISAAPDGGRALAAELYKELQAAGLDEPTAAALSHQIHRAAAAAPKETTPDA